MKSEFGKRLIELRKARGMTQYDLADAIGTTQRTISYYENEGGHPQAPVMVHLAQALNVSTNELLGVKRGLKPHKLGRSQPIMKTRRFAAAGKSLSNY